MEVQQVLHMKGGNGDTSYANNSLIQKKAISKAKQSLVNAIRELCSDSVPESLGIADLGCSSGPNTLFVISEIIDAIDAICRDLGRPSPEFRVFLNDLASNDFNTLFGSLPGFYDKLQKEKGEDFGPCYIAGVPGSFYERLFPNKSLHFVHSSYSLHWLSRVPPLLESEDGMALNKGNICVGKTSPPAVCKAYYEQFQKDFSSFLSSRSNEIVGGGRMVVALAGRRSEDPCNGSARWGLLANSLNDMVAQGIIQEAKLTSFNLPLYPPSIEEVRDVIERQGCFHLNHLEVYEQNFDLKLGDGEGNIESNRFEIAQNITKTIRAVSESMLASHFGEAIIEDLFHRFADKVIDDLSKEKHKFMNLVISMTKK